MGAYKKGDVVTVMYMDALGAQGGLAMVQNGFTARPMNATVIDDSQSGIYTVATEFGLAMTFSEDQLAPPASAGAGS